MGKRTKNKKNNRVWVRFAVIFGTLIAIVGVLFGTYYYFTNMTNSNYINYIYNYKSTVDKANNSVANSITGLDQLDIKDQDKVKSIISTLTSASGSLQGVLDKLNGADGSNRYNPPAKFQSQYNTFINGLTANKQIFTQTILILKNPQNNNVNDALTALGNDVTNTSNAYESVKLGKAYFALPNGILTLPNMVSTFAQKAYSEYSAKLQLLQTYNDYFDKMDPINSGFQSNETDFNVSLNLVNSGQKNIDDLFVDIDNKLSDINTIYNTFSALNVPPKLGSTHKKLDSIFKSYISYCNDFKTNLTLLEQAGGDQTQLADVNQNFTNLESTFNSISNSFISYMKEFNNNRALYTDISNL